ncbi:pentapeptide repeat-containing protein [Actinoplanes sp. M2I2]|uniref:pentapeptide repeat-containing protein n=1 Tax=Actinoplanes sp. M2I2 TaxID=1734444 RepID=UPI00202172C6|nr:pentapeptide repeat-containing protein [Actinoplanes sp. M2I2]
MGGVYGLQRLMIDSSTDAYAVVQVLSAFVRTHAPRPASKPKSVPSSPADVRAAFNVLSHRPYPEMHRTDLSNTLLGLDREDLANAELAYAYLADVNLSDVNLRKAILNGA